MKKVSVITPVWNRSDLTYRFLAQHWAMYTGSSDVEIIIVDNGSIDDTQQVLQDWSRVMGDMLKTVDLPKNMGFGPGNNRGVEIAGGDILAFVSNDVNVEGNYILPIQTAYLYDQAGTLFGAEIFSHNTGWNTFEEVGTIPYIAGWCVIADRDTWDKIGPWDERFIPCDYEDLDLSYRAVRAGYKLQKMHLPLKHDSGKSAERLPEGRLKVTLENQKRFLEKWGLTLI